MAGLQACAAGGATPAPGVPPSLAPLGTPAAPPHPSGLTAGRPRAARQPCEAPVQCWRGPAYSSDGGRRRRSDPMLRKRAGRAASGRSSGLRPTSSRLWAWTTRQRWQY